MTTPQNMSTRRLKRAYLRAVKRHWRWGARISNDAGWWTRKEAVDTSHYWGSRVDSCAEELRHRGWSA